MKQSGSLLFPFKQNNENDCLERAYTVEDTVISSIKVFLITRKGSRVGSDIGSILPSLKFSLINSSQIKTYEKEIEKELIENFPGVDFINIKLEQKRIENSFTLKLDIQLFILEKELNIELTV